MFALNLIHFLVSAFLVLAFLESLVVCNLAKLVRHEISALLVQFFLQACGCLVLVKQQSCPLIVVADLVLRVHALISWLGGLGVVGLALLPLFLKLRRVLHAVRRKLQRVNLRRHSKALIFTHSQ